MLNPKKRFKKMKKFILSLGLILMALNLTNCAKFEEATPAVETKGDFAIYASTETRTANDGLNTVWSTGDDLNVFHAVTDGTTYTQDGQFKLQDVETGQFLGNLNGTLDAQEEYDWYAMYPYSSYVKHPNSSGYMTIGCSASATQTQTGNNSMAHIAGNNYPLVGKAYAVPANQSPALAMTHVATLLEFEVTNSLEEAITVSNITFTAPADLVGTFYIDFDEIDKITVKSSGANYTSKTATLEVKNGEAIEAGKSAKFYLPVAPFTANASDKLSIEVNVTAGEKFGVLAKDITLAETTTFKAGKIKNVKVNYNAEFVEVNEDWVDNAYNLVTSASHLNAGDKVIIVAKDSNFALSATQNNNNRGQAAITKNSNNTVEFDNNVQILTLKEGTVDGTFAFYTGSGYLYAASSSSNHLKTQTTKDANGSWSIVVNTTDGTAAIVAQGANTHNVMRYNQTSSLFSCYESASQKPICIYKLVGEYTPAVPAIDYSIGDVNLAADATSGEAEVVATNADGWNITAEADAGWITDLQYANSKITFSSEANKGEARKATVTVTAVKEGYDNVEKTFTITQAKFSTGDDVAEGAQYSYTFTAKQFSANGTKNLGGLNWTLAGDGGYWGWDSNGKGHQFGSGNKPYKNMTLTISGYEGGINTIKINTSGASSISASFTVSVNGKQIGAKTSLTTSATEYTFTTNDNELLTGDIVFTYTQTSKKAIYIKSIAIN